jgi:hypothetical protein
VGQTGSPAADLGMGLWLERLGIARSEKAPILLLAGLLLTLLLPANMLQISPIREKNLLQSALDVWHLLYYDN